MWARSFLYRHRQRKYSVYRLVSFDRQRHGSHIHTVYGYDTNYKKFFYFNEQIKLIFYLLFHYILNDLKKNN